MHVAFTAQMEDKAGLLHVRQACSMPFISRSTAPVCMLLDALLSCVTLILLPAYDVHVNLTVHHVVAVV